MKIVLTTRERLAIASIMQTGAWGGSPQALIAQADIYDALGLAAFAGLTPAALARLNSDVDRTAYEIPDTAGGVLAGIVSAGGQGIALAMITVGILRRLDPVAAMAAAPPAPPAAAADGPYETGAAAPKRKARVKK